MEDFVRPQIYATMPAAEVEAQLRRDKMPAPFLRRMRVINLLSAVTLRKIEDNMLAPFKVMDLHHVLDNQISQDAIIAMLENKSLATALETGNLAPLWAESETKPLLRKGFDQGWIQRFNTEPFDPICVMLAMRAKLMLDVVDEEGHSYDLLRSMGMGWIDFGEIPGEVPGNPDSYVPPVINAPIDYPDDQGDGVPGDPDYVPGPDDPGYIPPPDREPGDPGYPIVPGETPGYPDGWDEAIHPGHPDYDPSPGEAGYVYPSSPGEGFYGGDFGPGGQGARGGPGGGGGIYGDLAPPLGLGSGPSDLLARGWGSWGGGGGAIDCCLDYQDPESYVGLGYETETMNLTEEQELTVTQADASCKGENYSWEITAGGGELSAETGLSVIYTAPLTAHGCPGNTEITLFCGGFAMAALDITINIVYAIEWDYEASAAEIAREDSEIIWVSANGTPLTWSVSGTGFSLEHEETDGTSNVLHADATACGPATITVTDCDENEATGYVRCTTGQWVLKTGTCDMAGVAGDIVILNYHFEVTAIRGYQKQRSVYSSTAGSTGWFDTCEEARATMPNLGFDCSTFTLPCADIFPPGDTVVLGSPRVCEEEDCDYWAAGDKYRMSFRIFSSADHYYYEWEC